MDLKTTMLRNLLAGMHYSGAARAFHASGVRPHLGVILTLHHVRPSSEKVFDPNGHLSVDPAFFEKVILHCQKIGLEPISLDEAHARILAGKSEKPFVCFTFDDGYRDNLEIAAPILRKHSIPYTVFVTTGFVEGEADLWWDGVENVIRNQDSISVDLGQGVVELDCSNLSEKINSYKCVLDYLVHTIPEGEIQPFVRSLCKKYDVDLDAIRTREIMTWEEVSTLQSDPLCTIGAHTLTHPILARTDAENARREMANGSAVLGQALGTHQDHFAYPFGSKMAAKHREFELAKELGFKIGVTTVPGMIFPEHKTALAALPRISVNGFYQEICYFAPLMTGLPSFLSNKGKRLQTGDA